jgi:hypothetical protein
MHSYARHTVLTHYILNTRLTALEASYSILLLNLHSILKQWYKCTGLYMLGYVVINPNKLNSWQQQEDDSANRAKAETILKRIKEDSRYQSIPASCLKFRFKVF